MVQATVIPQEDDMLYIEGEYKLNASELADAKLKKAKPAATGKFQTRVLKTEKLSTAMSQINVKVQPRDNWFTSLLSLVLPVLLIGGIIYFLFSRFHAVGKNVVDRLHFDGTHILPFRSGRHVPGPEPDIERRLFGGIDEGVCHLVRRAGLDGEIHIETARTSRQDTFAAGLGAIRQNVQRRRFVRDGLRVPRFAVFGKRTCYSSRKENGERKRHKSYLFYRRMIAVYGNT